MASNVPGNLKLPSGKQEGSDVWLIEGRVLASGSLQLLRCAENAWGSQFAILEQSGWPEEHLYPIVPTHGLTLIVLGNH